MYYGSYKKNPIILYLYFAKLEKATLFSLEKKWNAEKTDKCTYDIYSLLLVRVQRGFEGARNVPSFVQQWGTSLHRGHVSSLLYGARPRSFRGAFFRLALFTRFLRLRFLFVLKEKKTTKSAVHTHDGFCSKYVSFPRCRKYLAAGWRYNHLLVSLRRNGGYETHNHFLLWNARSKETFKKHICLRSISRS